MLQKEYRQIKAGIIFIRERCRNREAHRVTATIGSFGREKFRKQSNRFNLHEDITPNIGHYMILSYVKKSFLEE